MAYSDKVVDHYDTPQRRHPRQELVRSRHRPGRRARVRRRDAPPDPRQPRHPGHRGRQVQDLRLRLGHRLQLPRHRVGQGKTVAEPSPSPTPTSSRSSPSAGQDPLLRPRRRRHRAASRLEEEEPRHRGSQRSRRNRRRRPLTGALKARSILAWGNAPGLGAVEELRAEGPR